MSSKDFAYWLQGLFELADPKTLDEKQVDLIKKHLNMVFVHEIDPSYGDKEKQDKLDEIHNGPPVKTLPWINPAVNWSDYGIDIKAEEDKLKQELHNIHTPDPESRPRC